MERLLKAIAFGPEHESVHPNAKRLIIRMIIHEWEWFTYDYSVNYSVGDLSDHGNTMQFLFWLFEQV